MSKTRKNMKGNYLRKITNTGKKAIPVVKTGLRTVGNTAKVVAVKAAPIVEKGVSEVYDTMVTGFDLGVKGLKSISNKKTTGRRTKRHYKGRK
jgi:hypothetical protein